MPDVPSAWPDAITPVYVGCKAFPVLSSLKAQQKTRGNKSWRRDEVIEMV